MKLKLAGWACALAVALNLSPGIHSASAQQTDASSNTVEQAETQTTQAVENAESNAVQNPEDVAPSRARIHRQAVVVFGRDVELKADERADAVVVIGGSAKVFGDVDHAVVAIGGNVETHGKVGRAAVAIGGDVEVHGRVRESAVAVMGNVKIAPGAKVEGDVVSVGGKTEVGEGASIRGRVQDVDFVFTGSPIFKNLGVWLRECVLKMRPLAPQVGWVWVVAGVAFLFYLLVATAFGRPVQICLDELTERPATTFLFGLLAKVLVPIFILILLMTGVGILVVIPLVPVLFFAAIVGKVALLEYFGVTLGRPFGLPVGRPLLGFLIGAILITLLYMVPVVGFITYSVFGIWGLGVAMTGAFRKMRREKPPRNIAGPGADPLATGAAAVPMATNLAANSPAAPIASNPSPSAVPSEPPIQPPLPVALAHPQAGFWERMGAGFLDLALIGVAGGWTGPFVLVVALAYFAGMWAWKGTTIGGIVLKLQVVRQDGGPVTFLVALVRGLAAAFSAFVLFLGFFWIGWDPDKQGWHDKIAGTLVVRLPHSMPLVCI